MAQTRVNFADFTESWGPKVLPMWKPSASVTARQHIRRFLIPAFGQMRLQDVNTEAVQGMIAGMVRLGSSRSYVQNVHALASVLVAEGANPKVAQKQLGHSNIQTTLDLYSHIIGDEQRKAVSRAAESFMPTLLTGTGRVN